MALVVEKLAILGQGLIGSSITRAVFERNLAKQVTITDASPKVRKRLLELGLGSAKVVDSNEEAVADADLVIACVPVGIYGLVAEQIGPHLKQGDPLRCWFSKNQYHFRYRAFFTKPYSFHSCPSFGRDRIFWT